MPPLARAVAGARDLEAARDALAGLGIRTELDYERAQARTALEAHPMRMRGPGRGYRTAVDPDIRHPHCSRTASAPIPIARSVQAIEDGWRGSWLAALRQHVAARSTVLSAGDDAGSPDGDAKTRPESDPQATASAPAHAVAARGGRDQRAVPAPAPDPTHAHPVRSGGSEQPRGNDPERDTRSRFALLLRNRVRAPGGPNCGRLIPTCPAQVERAEREHALADPAVVIKEPNGSHGADLIMALLPRARLIFLVRDARDVIDSLMDAMSGGWLDEPHMGRLDTPEQRLAFARSEARVWLERTRAVERAFDAHDPELRWKLRYEDLRTDTVGTAPARGLARYSTIGAELSGGDRRQRVRGDSTCGEGSRDPRGPQPRACGAST